MEYLQTVWQQMLNMQFTDFLDIFIVAFLIYKLMPLLRSTGTARIGGVVLTVIVIAGLTDLFNLHTLSFILNQLLAVGLIAVVVLFQPELRRMIDHLSGMKLKRFLGVHKQEQELEQELVLLVRH